MFLILIDAHSKWLEVCPVNSATSIATIDKLRLIFCTHGLPEVIVTDNGTCFTSSEFETFLAHNGIVHVKTSPYHAASNGLAERAVQIFKRSLTNVTGGSLENRISKFLFRYRITPHSTTGVSPAELLMGRKIRSHLDLLHPGVKARVFGKQESQKMHHDHHSKTRFMNPGDDVHVFNFGSGERWLPGILTERTGPVSYKVTLHDGRVVRRHQDHVRLRHTSSDIGDEQHEQPSWPSVFSPHTERVGIDVSEPASPEVVPTSQSSTDSSIADQVLSPSSGLSQSSPSSTVERSSEVVSTPKLPRRSSRISKPPDRLVYT